MHDHYTRPMVTSRSIACTSPGTTCGSFKIDSANLTVATTTNNGTLPVMLTNTSAGSNGISTAITYFINSEELGQSRGIAANQTQIYSLSVPSLYGLVAGQSYTVTVQMVIVGETLSQEISVTVKV